MDSQMQSLKVQRCCQLKYWIALIQFTEKLVEISYRINAVENEFFLDCILLRARTASYSYILLTPSYKEVFLRCL